MFIVLLELGKERARASELLAEHNAWIQRGFADGVFVLVGTIEPKLGGAILAHRCSRPDLEHRVSEDPFVRESVVSARIVEVTPGRLDQRLDFLAAPS